MFMDIHLFLFWASIMKRRVWHFCNNSIVTLHRLKCQNHSYMVRSVSRLNAVLRITNAYILMNLVPFSVVFLGLNTVSPVIVPPFEAFCEVDCLKCGKCIL